MSLPTKLGAYFSGSLPVVAAVDANDEVARELAAADAGIVVPAESPHEVLRAPLKLREDPRLARSLGTSGRRFAESQLSPERAFAAMKDVLEAAVQGRVASAGTGHVRVGDAASASSRKGIA
jgi:glycosyltransferase involved in cell wall biosynthesis